jgi:hypothetical protein
MTFARGAVPLVLALALGGGGLAGCGGGASPAPGGTTSAVGPSPAAPSAAEGATSPPPTGTATVVSGGSGPGPRPTATSSSTPVAGATSATPGGRDLGYRVTYRRVAEQVGTARLSSVYPAVSVTGPNAARARTVRAALHDRIEAQRRSFLQAAGADTPADTPDPGQPQEDSEEEITVLREVRWGWLYSVQFADYSYASGAAHPVTQLFAVTVDWRTGRVVSAGTVFASVAPVDRAVRAALLQRDVDSDVAASLTVGPAGVGQITVDAAPTPKGLWVGVSHCIATCALGPIEVTVPWSRLPAPRPGVLPPATR